MATPFPVGCNIIVQYLDNGAQLNGKHGIVQSNLNSSGRHEVLIINTTKRISIKPINMRHNNETSSTKNKTNQHQDQEAVDESVRSRNLWQFAGLSIRDTIAATQTTLQRGLATAKKSLSLPEGSIAIEFSELKVYKPHDTIKGVIKIKLKDAMYADRLSITLRAVRPIKTKGNNDNDGDEEETVFDEKYEICNDSQGVYPTNCNFPFEIIIPRLGKNPTRDASLLSSLVYEFKNLQYTGVAKWTMFASLNSPGGSLRSMHSPEYRIHVDD